MVEAKPNYLGIGMGACALFGGAVRSGSRVKGDVAVQFLSPQ